jgi:hypothetical protein
MKSIRMDLDGDRTYRESEINERLQRWNCEVAPAIATDHVSLRRMLVDYGHLERTADGASYRLGYPPRPLAFDLEIDDLDLRATVAAYRGHLERAQLERAQLERARRRERPR